MPAIKINAVAYPEGDVWVVQGVEFDICAHADDAAGVPAAFLRAVAENVAISQHLGRQPLQGIRPAPPRFRTLFERSSTQLRSLENPDLPDTPIASVDIRLAAHG
jgi:hypothetical protein